MFDRNGQNHQRIRKKLEAFRNAKEWSDFISLLTAVDNVLIDVKSLPKDLEGFLFRRLNQSLNPALPAGVHNKALETYKLIIANIKLTDRLLLGLFSYGVYSKLSVKDTFFEVLANLNDRKVGPKSFILGLLPFVEEENNEYFDRACIMIDNVNCSDALWSNFLCCPELRIAVVNYFKGRQAAISSFQIRAISKALYDGDSFTVRGTLDMLNANVKLGDLVRFYNPEVTEFVEVTEEQIANDKNTRVSDTVTGREASTTVMITETTAVEGAKNQEVHKKIKVEDAYLKDEIVSLSVHIIKLFLKKEITLNKKVNAWLQNETILAKKALRKIMNDDLNLFYKLFQNLIVQEELNDKDIAELFIEAAYKTQTECQGFDIVLTLLESSFLWKILYVEFKRIIGKEKGNNQFRAKTEKNETASGLGNRAENEMRSGVRDEMKNEMRSGVKDEMKNEMRSGVKDEMKNEMRSGVRDEVKNEMRSGVRDEVKNEMRSGVRDEVKNEMRSGVRDEVKGKEKKNGTNYDQTKSGERPGERKNESITGNNERQARTGSTILRDEETDRADKLAMEMNKEEGREGRRTPEDLPKREETEERHIDDEKRRIDEGSRGKVDKSTGKEEYSDRSRERTSVLGDDKLKQGITTNATEREDKEMKQEINEALGYNANKGLNNEMSQRASEELNGNVHGGVNDEVNKRTRDKMNEPDEAPYDPRVELSNNVSRTPKNRTELLNERNDRIEQPMDVRRSSSSSEQSLRTVNKAFGTVNEPRGLSNDHNSALKTKELRENSWEHKSDEEHTNEMNASEMGREGIVLKNGTACVGNSNVEVSRSVHNSGETSEIRLAGGEGSDMAQLTRQVKHDESDKSITLDELSKVGIALPEDVGPNDMLNLIKFLFTNTMLQEKKNNVHALHILLMLSINSDIFEESRLNEVVRILLDLINFQEALMYAVNYSNLLVSTPAPGEDSTGEMEHNSSGQSIDTYASNVEAVDAMIESKLDNFYFSNGKPVKYIALERINLTNDTLLIVVKHFNPFNHEFWMSYVEQKDLREVFFILRHVLKSSALERCKRTLFVRLFYGYDEKLFMAYELIYERGFEELLIEEVQMNKSRRIDYDRDVVEEEVVGEGNETEGNIGKGMERNFRSGIGGSVGDRAGGDIENEVQGEERRNVGDRTGRDIENEKRTGDEKRYGEDKTNQSSGISRKENDKSTVIVDQRNKHGNKCEQICLKILKYSFNVLNTFTFYKTLNIISNRPIIPFFSSLSSSALFNKIIDDRNIVLMHKMLQYNHKFVKHLRRGVNLFDVIFNARAVRTYAQLPKTSEEYVLVISIVKYLLRLNLVPSINYSAIYARAPLSFFYDTLELVEHVLADKNAYPFFLESVPRNNIVFKIKNREFLKDFYLTVVNEYYGVCVDCLRVDGAVGDASRTWCEGTAGVKDGNGRENNKGDENGRDDGNTVGIKIRNETSSNRVTRTVEQIDLVFLLDVIKRVNKRKHEFGMGTITERVLFILSVVYRRHGAYSTNKEIIADTIYDLRDEEELPEKDSFTFQTVMNSILDIIIGESTFINAYIKYFSTRLPLNEKLNRRIFLLVLQSNKYAYLNRVFAPNGPVLKNAVDLSKLIDIGTITETEKLAINNVFLERLKISGTSYFNLFFNDYIANQKKIENVSHLYFLMSNMNKKASTHRLIEMCLQYLCKAVQSKKKIGSNLMRVCLRGCGVPLSDRRRGYVCSIAYFLIKREQEVNLEVEGYNERYEHVMLVHQGGDRGRKEAMSKNESRENDNSRGASSIRNDCTSCNSGQSIGLDTLIYHNIGIKEYFEYFLESATFFKGTKCSLIKKSILLQQIDADRIQELFSRLNSNFFTGKEADSLNKASVIKRISFFILSLDFEAFSAHLPAIIPIINELIEYPKPVKREIYNLISVIFIKFHHNNLSALFPIYFSEIENDSLLESIRSLEMLMLIGSKETVEFRWYISCTKDDNTLFKRMLNELYRGTEVRPYLDRLPATRMPLLMNDKKAFLSRAESYYEMLDESVWSIDEGLLSSWMVEWYVGGV